jgi:hypothetical protein
MQQPIRKSGFPVIYMSNDAEISNVRRVHLLQIRDKFRVTNDASASGNHSARGLLLGRREDTLILTE